MKIFIYPALLILFFLPFIVTPSSRASGHGGRGAEVIYPLFYGSGSGPCGGRQPCLHLPRIDGEVRVEVKEIKDGVAIRLTSEDEKTMKELRLMGRMIKLGNDMKELEGEGR